MEEIVELSKHYTKRVLQLLVAGQYWGIQREFKLAPGLTVEEIDQGVRDFELSYSRLVMPAETVLSSVQVFNFDDRQYNSGPLPRGSNSHNTIIYVSDGGSKWAQDFYLWSAIGRSRHTLKLVFRKVGEEVIVSYDGIYQN
ncbi:hypothetical protein BH11CYA1_BH11CYA1_21160 [soil metagenome]